MTTDVLDAVAAPHPRTRPRVDRRSLVVWLVIGLTLLGLWLYGLTTFFIPCQQNCGETFDALQYVDNYRLYGFRYWLVQDMATSPAPEARPYFYTHNVNFAGLLFTVLDAIGLTPFWTKQLVTLLGFGVGLFYAYRATAYHIRSWLAGLCVLLLFVTDLEHVIHFGLNPLRAWHWLAIFGLLFHAGRLGRQPTLHPRRDWVAIVLCATLAFGIGYDFWIIGMALALLTVVVYRVRRLLALPNLLTYVGVGLAFALPFVLRQIQIAAVLGPRFWFLDVFYSAAIKVSVLSRFIAIPSTEQIDAMYQAAGVLRPPAAPAPTLYSIYVTLRDLITYVVIPSYGLLPYTLAVVGMAVAIVATLVLVVTRPRVAIGWLHRLGVRGRVRGHVVGAVRMIAVLVVAVELGIAFFAPLSLHIYLKHEFPLIGAPILAIKGIVLAGLLSMAMTMRGGLRVAGTALAALLVIDHAIVQFNDARARQPMDVSWIPAVSARQDATFVVSWIPSAVSVITDTWAVGLAPGRERVVSARFAQQQPPFTLADYFLFGERDGQAHADLYTKPDYWLYFPIDQTTPFDHPSPDCRQDYLTGLLNELGIGGAGNNVTVSALSAQPSRVRPGGLVTFGGLVDNNRGRRFRAEVFRDDKIVAQPNFNCQYGKMLGEYRIPQDAAPVIVKFTARLVAPDGRTVQLAEAQVLVDPNAPLSPPPTAGAQPPQPSVAELIGLNPNLPVAERGADFVIFDLRGYIGRH